MPSVIFAIYCHILLYSRSGAALRIAEVDDDSFPSCPANDAGKTCSANVCCDNQGDNKKTANSVAQKDCPGKLDATWKYASWAKGDTCTTYKTCAFKDKCEAVGKEDTVKVVFYVSGTKVTDETSTSCPAKDAGKTCTANACCVNTVPKKATKNSVAKALCANEIKAPKKYASWKGGTCTTYDTCKKKAQCDKTKDDTVTVFYKDGTKITGDPHVVNMAGEKFDILATGAFSLLSLTRATEEDLLINGTIARFGAKCGESFITHLENTGGWIRKAYNTEALKVRAVQHTAKTEALQVNFGQKWEPLSNLQEMAHLSKAAGAIHLDFSSVTVKVSAGKHWRHGWNFLNLDVQGLASLDDNIRVGGLLGYDDHTHVLQADADCAMFAEAAGADMQDQQSCLSYLKAN